MNSRPAGFSSDEDEFDDFGFEEYKPRRTHHYQPKILTPDEKLIDAICSNDVNATREALDEGADIHFRSNYSSNHTPIMKAASFGHLEIMELLISRGANVNDDFEMFNVIFCLVNSSIRDENTLLKCLELLLKNGANPLTTDWTGTTALMNAVRWDRQLLAAKLLESGCSVNATDGEGWSPLFYAVQAGSIPMTKFLINAGGNIKQMTRFGVTLWEHAAPKDDPQLSTLVTPKEILEAMNNEDVVVDYEPRTSQFKRILSQCPKTDNRLYGFHEDAIRFIRGIGLHNVASAMEKRNIQLSELLTWSEKDWIDAGVQFSYPLKKLNFCVTKYHEKEWSKGSIPKMDRIISIETGQVDLFAVTQSLLSCLRNIHINSASSLYLLKNHKEPLSNEIKDELDCILQKITIVKKQVRLISCIMEKIDSPETYPPDLIVQKNTSCWTKSFSAMLMDSLCRNAVHIAIHLSWNSF